MSSMGENLLFNIPDPPKRGEKGKQCRDCEHLVQHGYRSDWHYCWAKTDNRTQCGHPRRNKTAPICLKFKPLEE